MIPPINAAFLGAAIVAGLLCLVGGAIAATIPESVLSRAAMRHVKRLALAAGALAGLGLGWRP